MKTWPTRKAAAADLAVLLGRPITAATLAKRWSLDPACPLPKGRGPIPRTALLEYARRKMGIPMPGVAAPNPERDARAELLQLKVAAIKGAAIPLEAVHAGINAAMAELRRAFLDELPMTIAIDARGKPAEEAAELIRERLRAALNAFAEAAAPPAAPGAP